MKTQVKPLCKGTLFVVEVVTEGHSPRRLLSVQRCFHLHRTEERAWLCASRLLSLSPSQLGSFLTVPKLVRHRAQHGGRIAA
jgi:hypothetical protein